VTVPSFPQALPPWDRDWVEYDRRTTAGQAVGLTQRVVSLVGGRSHSIGPQIKVGDLRGLAPRTPQPCSPPADHRRDRTQREAVESTPPVIHTRRRVSARYNPGGEKGSFHAQL